MPEGRDHRGGVTLPSVCPRSKMKSYGKYGGETVGECSLRNLKPSRKDKNTRCGNFYQKWYKIHYCESLGKEEGV